MFLAEQPVKLFHNFITRFELIVDELRAYTTLSITLSYKFQICVIYFYFFMNEFFKVAYHAIMKNLNSTPKFL